MLQKVKQYSIPAIKFLIVCMIVLNFIQGLFLIKNRKFDEDEFEHTHVVWCMKEDNMSIYKDFFEHHGPIYPYLNKIVWSVFEPDNNEDVLFLFRYLNFILSILLCILVFKVVNFAVGKSWGWLSVLILSSNTFFQKAAWEIRTDNLLHCFWLFSIYLLLRDFKRYKHLILMVVGGLWGLAIFTMIKSILLIFSFVIGMVIVHKKDLRQFVLSDCLSVILGVFIVALFSLLITILNGGVKEFFFYQFIVNFIIQVFSRTPVNYLLKEFLQENFFFVALLMISIFSFKQLLNGIKNNSLVKIYLFSAMIPLCLVLGPSYHHDYLMFIIPFVVMNAMVLKKISNYQKRKKWFVIFLCVIFFSNYFIVLKKNYFLILKEENQTQLRFLEKVQKVNIEKAPILYFWGRLGGYSFQKHLNYFWYMDDFSQDLVRFLRGNNIYDSCLDNLKTMRKKTLVIIEDEEWDSLPPKLKLILKSNYKKDMQFPLYYYKGLD